MSVLPILHHHRLVGLDAAYPNRLQLVPWLLFECCASSIHGQDRGLTDQAGCCLYQVVLETFEAAQVFDGIKMGAVIQASMQF